MADKPFPENEAGINLLLQGLAVKLPTYQAALALSVADVDFITKAAANYQYLINTTPQVTDSKESFTKLKDTYFNGLNNGIAPSMTVFPIIAVPNSKTLGIVPETKLGRAFRDRAGTLNQHLAARAGKVILMVAGLPLTVKPER